MEGIIQNEAEKQQGETGQVSKEQTQTTEEGVSKNVRFESQNVENLPEFILTSFEVRV